MTFDEFISLKNAPIHKDVLDPLPAPVDISD